MLKSEVLRKKVVMEYTEYYWEAAKKTSLYAQIWYTSDKPKGVINLIHGFGEHSTRYADWAKKFVLKDYTVRTFDLRGHGRSEGNPGHIKNYDLLLDDLNTFIQKGREDFPMLPFFLYGHDLGATLALNYMMDHPQPIDGIIVSSPWLQLTHEAHPIVTAVRDKISNILPKYMIASPIHPENISHDIKVVHNFRSDLLCQHNISLKFLKQIQHRSAQAAISIYKINCPLLVMHGSNDEITSCKASQNFVRNASKKTQYFEWEGAYHELHNDIVKEEVFETASKWLDTYSIQNDK